MTREECNEHFTSKRGLYSHFKYIADALADLHVFVKADDSMTNLVEHDEGHRSAHVNEAGQPVQVRISLIISNNSWNEMGVDAPHSHWGGGGGVKFMFINERWLSDVKQLNICAIFY